MSKRPAARPPRKPRAEPAKVTIGVLERRCVELVSRIENLVAARDDATNLRQEMQRERDAANLARLEAQRNSHLFREQLNECQAKLASVEQRFEGYRMHVSDTKP